MADVSLLTVIEVEPVVSAVTESPANAGTGGVNRIGLALERRAAVDRVSQIVPRVKCGARQAGRGQKISRHVLNAMPMLPVVLLVSTNRLLVVSYDALTPAAELLMLSSTDWTVSCRHCN